MSPRKTLFSDGDRKRAQSSIANARLSTREKSFKNVFKDSDKQSLPSSRKSAISAKNIYFDASRGELRSALIKPRRNEDFGWALKNRCFSKLWPKFVLKQAEKVKKKK
ncbi:hypothetical protein HY489_04515 [Candidatus Woesearchaeota archaeon]|nr:hypothetical protein [Candidatus Woesearchaeota archaeon]